MQALLTNKEDELRNSNLSDNETYCTEDVAWGSGKKFNVGQLNDSAYNDHARLNDQNLVHNLASYHFPKYIQNDYIEHKVHELKLENNNVKEDISQLHDQFEKFAEKSLDNNIKDHSEDNSHAPNEFNDLIRKLDTDNVKDPDIQQKHDTDNVKESINNTDRVHDKFEEQF